MPHSRQRLFAIKALSKTAYSSLKLILFGFGSRTHTLPYAHTQARTVANTKQSIACRPQRGRERERGRGIEKADEPRLPFSFAQSNLLFLRLLLSKLTGHFGFDLQRLWAAYHTIPHHLRPRHRGQRKECDDAKDEVSLVSGTVRVRNPRPERNRRGGVHTRRHLSLQKKRIEHTRTHRTTSLN